VCPPHRSATTPPVDTARGTALPAALAKIDFAKLDTARQRTHLRTIQIVLNRFDRPDAATVKALIAKLDPLFPAATPEANGRLCETLVYLQSPTVATKAIALITSAPICPDLSEPNNPTRVDRTEVKSIEPSKISPLPPMLLNMLTRTRSSTSLPMCWAAATRSTRCLPVERRAGREPVAC